MNQKTRKHPGSLVLLFSPSPPSLFFWFSMFRFVLPIRGTCFVSGRRYFSYQQSEKKDTFYDMVHSNNAARIRLFLDLQKLHSQVDTVYLLFDQLQDPNYLKVNPMKKVPAFTTSSGLRLFEASVIMAYLEDKYSSQGVMDLMPSDPEERAKVNLMVRIHDLYIASPNCTQPLFSHTQGGMYLPPRETEVFSASRVVDRPTRAAKLAEIWKHMSWLEETCEVDLADDKQENLLIGGKLTHADLTWFPTTVFMEYLLPRVFGWPEIFREKEHFPKLKAWFEFLEQNEHFSKVREGIWKHWTKMDETGQLDLVRDEITDKTYKWQYP